MKKLAIVAVALVLAMVFVGCGAVSLLAGSSWDTQWKYGDWARFEFLEDGVCTYYEAATQEMLDDVLPTNVLNWAADGNQLSLTFAVSGGKYGTYTVVIKGNEMTWTNVDNEDDVVVLTRVAK